MLKPEFCWICGKLWRARSDGDYSRWFFSNGPFGYGICKKCDPLWQVVLPIASVIVSGPTTKGHCFSCKTDTYEGRSLHNHPRALGWGRDGVLCPECRKPVDEARHAAQEAERALWL